MHAISENSYEILLKIQIKRRKILPWHNTVFQWRQKTPGAESSNFDSFQQRVQTDKEGASSDLGS